jgi:hypothetical protein
MISEIDVKANPIRIALTMLASMVNLLARPRESGGRATGLTERRNRVVRKVAKRALTPIIAPTPLQTGAASSIRRFKIDAPIEANVTHHPQNSRRRNESVHSREPGPVNPCMLRAILLNVSAKGLGPSASLFCSSWSNPE